MLIDNKFKQWVESLSQNYKRAQIKAAIHVNSELINFYLYLGKEISGTKYKSVYGNEFYKNLSNELRLRLSNAKGLSERTLRYCYDFYTLYKGILQQVVAKLSLLPWGHHILIINKCKEIDAALFYVDYSIKNNFSRSQLELAIETYTFERSIDTLNNFLSALPKVDKKLCVDLIKDPYKFEFLELQDENNEKELKRELENNIKISY